VSGSFFRQDESTVCSLQTVLKLLYLYLIPFKGVDNGCFSFFDYPGDIVSVI